MKIRSIRKEANRIAGKTILLRADFNVPIERGKIKEDYKIVAVLPTLRFLLRYDCRVIIATHLGDPKSRNGKIPAAEKKKLTAKPLAAYLGKLIGKKVIFAETSEEAEEKMEKMKEIGVAMLENLRFDPGEKENDSVFAKRLAGSADFYVNDAFSASHRSHASVGAIKKFLPAFAGFRLEAELSNLEKALKPKKPLVLIMGGAKTETKSPIIKRFGRKAWRILLGGALANDFLAAKGLEIGKSVSSKDGAILARKLSRRNILVPVDCLVGGKTARKGESAGLRPANEVKKNEAILDIGPETIRLYAALIKKAATIVWNGPMGAFEREHFRQGTLSIARLVAARSSGAAFGVVGGGETIEALKMTEMENYIDWISTGGGAMLAYLGGEEMPGLKGIASRFF